MAVSGGDAGVVLFMIPIVAIISGTVLKMARLRNAQVRPPDDPELGARVAALEDDLAQVRQELSETQERLDFTERLIATERSKRELSPPPSEDHH